MILIGIGRYKFHIQKFHCWTNYTENGSDKKEPFGNRKNHNQDRNSFHRAITLLFIYRLLPFHLLIFVFKLFSRLSGKHALQLTMRPTDEYN